MVNICSTVNLTTLPEVARVRAEVLPVRCFLENYVASNTPVVVTGALRTLDLKEHWTPAALNRQFGKAPVQVYGDGFDLQTVMPLSKYLSQHMGKPVGCSASTPPYARWYSKFREVHFCWADKAFAQLRDAWCLPGFLPQTDYLLPLSPRGALVSPITDYFPAKGLFISPRGSRTCLHVDPWSSCAILLQLYGQKRWYFRAADRAPSLRNQTEVVGVIPSDRECLATSSVERMSKTCLLSEGEAIYVPHGWEHQVECESDSVSVTWNFVHSTTATAFLSWLRQPLSDFDRSVLAFSYQLPEYCDARQEVAERITARIADV